MKKRTLVSMIAAALVLCVSIGGVLAYLTDKTEKVTNTFTVGNIDITLAESPNLDLKMVPGNTIAKDPKVTVTANSEDSYVFVKVEKSSNLDSFIDYTMADGWIQLKDKDGNDVAGVYYREHSTVAVDTIYHVLASDTVTVKTTVTKDMMDGLKEDGATQPTLSFTAYAVQKANIADAYTAWTEATK